MRTSSVLLRPAATGSPVADGLVLEGSQIEFAPLTPTNFPIPSSRSIGFYLFSRELRASGPRLPSPRAEASSTDSAFLFSSFAVNVPARVSVVRSASRRKGWLTSLCTANSLGLIM
ncbi:BQ5605_C042g12041 [Microbotryum silenes-dioicae]|uniref:BQ5605_C042g12041 protein n=1 Tax=Microbotryum silenes-dioicae TaxID=796604 RepID=A0A2X0MTU9_9BASI|nr:BQ5605_C042g12041 [Microbotryum silenes-dioicae]